MKIGKIDFYKNIKLLSFAKFKIYWKDGNYEKRTGVADIEAAKVFGIKVPKKKNEGGE